jgi:N-acyl-D-aspartate/D-glutamate deacylase
MFDLVLKNGKIADGTGNPWYVSDIGILDGKIDKIGSIPTDQGRSSIEARGLVVSPGFIDIHSHADFVLPMENHMDTLGSYVRQGITTLVVGNCGLSPVPVNPDNLELLQNYTGFLQAGDIGWNWRTMADYLDILERSGVGYNVVPLVSHGAIRIAVMGFDGSPPTREQIKKMQELVAQAMADGAFGLSAGLIYAPGMFASTDELIEITKPLIPYRGVFSCHVRGSSETGIEATKEIIQIARVNGIPVEHSHMEAYGHGYWDHIDVQIRLHESARAEGLDVTFDVIPYVAANTTLTACFPPYVFEGGMDRFIERLKDKDQRKKIQYDVENMGSEWPTWLPGRWSHNLARAAGWKNIWLIWVPGEKNADYVGRSFEEIGKLQGKDPFDAVADLLIDEKGAAMAFYFGVSGDLESEEGLKRILAHPSGAINTDAILTGSGVPHPAAFGAFPRVLGQYVREEKIMSLEEAVRKMTSLSAQRFGVHDRGLIKEGICADITIFNESEVRDNATYTAPDKSPSGIEYVLINGQLVLESGKLNRDVRAGRVLRRQ